MSKDSQVTSFPEAGWSCQTLVEGVQLAAEQAGLELKTKDFSQAWQIKHIVHAMHDVWTFSHNICLSHACINEFACIVLIYI